jgi:hypothetical protein
MASIGNMVLPVLLLFMLKHIAFTTATNTSSNTLSSSIAHGLIELRLVTILPEDDSRIFSIKRVSPAIEFAIEKVNNNTKLLSGYKLSASYDDSKCDIAAAINTAIKSYMQGRVDAIFGPVCDYAVAPVARQAKFWNVPLVSCGAMARDFSIGREQYYPLLTRVGPVNFNSLSQFFVAQLRYHNFTKIKLLYDRTGQDNLVTGLCHLAIECLHPVQNY